MFRRLAPTATLTLVVLLAFSLAVPAIARRASSVDRDGPSEDQIAVRQLRQQIAAEELAVALELDEEQTEAMVDLVSEGVTVRASLKADREAAAPEHRELLGEYLRDIQKRGEARATTSEALREFREANRPEKTERKSRRKEVAARLKEILSEEQLAVLASFRPMTSVKGSGQAQNERPDRRGRDETRTEGRTDRGNRNDHQDRGQRRKTRKMVRKVLFSEAMLEVLQR
jgi:hypothetical protein